MAPQIGLILDEVFPENHIRIIAEPGRYICESSAHMAAQVIGQRDVDNGKHYYLNTGVYQGLLDRFTGEIYNLEPLIDESGERRRQ